MRKKNKNYLIQVGITSDNKPVISGIYKTYETCGISFDVILSLCLSKGWMLDWILLYKECLDGGIEHTRILSKLEESISDTFGKELSDVVISRLETIFN